MTCALRCTPIILSIILLNEAFHGETISGTSYVPMPDYRQKKVSMLLKEAPEVTHLVVDQLLFAIVLFQRGEEMNNIRVLLEEFDVSPRTRRFLLPTSPSN